MIKKLFCSTMICALSALSFCAVNAADAQAEEKLPSKIGDAALPLDNIELIKAPDYIKNSKDKVCKDLLVTDSKVTFEKGKVYVVEFWAAWCPPCRMAFPHIAELQKKYPENVIVLGITRPDGGQNRDQIIAMAKNANAKMDYRVCIDATGDAYKKFFNAFQQRGIPCAFVVDKDGKISWVGNPLASAGEGQPRGSALDEAVRVALGEKEAAAPAPKTETKAEQARRLRAEMKAAEEKAAAEKAAEQKKNEEKVLLPQGR